MRVFSVVDVWDALRSDRPYRAAWGDERVRAYIIEQSGRQFDPRMVQAFLQTLEDQQVVEKAAVSAVVSRSAAG